MYYPFLLYNQAVDHRPVFTGLKGDPYVADLSPDSPLLEGLDVRDQQGFQRRLEAKMGRHYRWGFAPYLERRDSLLGDCPQMVADQRFIHLGLDVIVDLGTPLHAPLDSTVAHAGYEAGDGNYGGHVLLSHESDYFETFYSFYGHLNKDRLPEKGTELKAGDEFALIGDFHENGNWFYHIHLQVITQKGLDAGYISKGYCSAADLATMDLLCPSPLSLFVV